MAISTGSFLLDLLGVFTAIAVALYAYFKWSFDYWQRRSIPYLQPKFPFGNFQNPSSRTRSLGDEIVDMYERAKAKGWKYCGIFNMAKPNLIILDLELLKHVLTKDFSHFTDRGAYINERDDPLSAHLFSMGGVKWRNLRVKLTPTFTSGKMKQMFQTLVDTGLVLEKHLEGNVRGAEPVDIKETVARFSTDIIGSCAFGLECNSFKDPQAPFRVYGKRAFSPTKFEIFKGVLFTNFPNLGRLLRLAVIPKEVTSFFTKIVEDTVNYREKNGINRKDFMQLLIDIKNNEKGQQNGANGLQDEKTAGLTINEISAQSFLFFLAGFETSSTTTTFALFELATHPEIQEKVRDEITSVLAKYDNKMTYDSLSELKYMRQVIDETLRMYPPVPFLTRECGEDYKVPGQDIIIEKGLTVVIPIRGIHYDEEYYKDPEVFDPERFREENKEARNRYAHIPFGEGPRICIGERFGVMQTKVALTTILRRFRVKLNEKTKVPLKMSTTSFIPTTEGDIWLTLEKL